MASFHVCDSRGEEVVMSAEMPLVKEVTTTLREWGSIWKQLFVVNNRRKISQRRHEYVHVVVCQTVTPSVSPSRPIKRRV